MGNVLIEFGNSRKVDTMSSLEIAELTGKQHAHVLRDIRSLLEQGVAASNFGLGEYTDKNNQSRPCYNLTKKGCLILASGYDAKLREKIIDRWEALETGSAIPFYRLPQSYSEALRELADQVERNQQLMLENKKQQDIIVEKEEALVTANAQMSELSNEIELMKPKVNYYDLILNNKSTVLITQIAQDYGMSAKAMNKILLDMRIQHKVNGQWILYANHIGNGYVQSKPIDILHSNGNKSVKYNTEWTQKGRIFLYEQLKKKGILPLIERN